MDRRRTRYQDRIAPALTHYRIPESISSLITGSLGGALAVAQRVSGRLGTELAIYARQAFVSGMDLAVTVGAIVVGGAAVVVLVLLPNRAASSEPAGPRDRAQRPDEEVPQGASSTREPG